MSKWTEDEVSKPISNPIYCLRWRGAEPIISEDFGSRRQPCASNGTGIKMEA